VKGLVSLPGFVDDQSRTHTLHTHPEVLVPCSTYTENYTEPTYIEDVIILIIDQTVQCLAPSPSPHPVHMEKEERRRRGSGSSFHTMKPDASLTPKSIHTYTHRQKREWVSPSLSKYTCTVHNH